MTTTDTARVLAWTTAARLDLADFLDTLDDADWRAASLCPGWTAHDVAAHLTMSTRTTLLGTIVTAIKARGSFERMEADVARERAARFTPAELIAQFRETAASPRRAPGSGLLDPLTDALVHGEDIARPLGRARTLPTEPAIAALEHVRGSRWYGARERLRDTRLVATDADWTAGDGPHEVRGAVADLLLVATGRPAGLPGLSGPGAERVAAAMARVTS